MTTKVEGRFFRVIYEDFTATTVWGTSREDVIRWLEKQKIKYKKVEDLY